MSPEVRASRYVFPQLIRYDARAHAQEVMASNQERHRLRQLGFAPGNWTYEQIAADFKRWQKIDEVFSTSTVCLCF